MLSTFDNPVLKAPSTTSLYIVLLPSLLSAATSLHIPASLNATCSAPPDSRYFLTGNRTPANSLPLAGFS
jgi:hypothetical protein